MNKTEWQESILCVLGGLWHTYTNTTTNFENMTLTQLQEVLENWTNSRITDSICLLYLEKTLKERVFLFLSRYPNTNYQNAKAFYNSYINEN